MRRRPLRRRAAALGRDSHRKMSGWCSVANGVCAASAERCHWNPVRWTACVFNRSSDAQFPVALRPRMSCYGREDAVRVAPVGIRPKHGLGRVFTTRSAHRRPNSGLPSDARPSVERRLVHRRRREGNVSSEGARLPADSCCLDRAYMPYTATVRLAASMCVVAGHERRRTVLEGRVAG